MSNKLKVGAAFLLAWYGFARWIMLGMTNDISVVWLSNPLGNFVALVSIVYLVYTIVKYAPMKSQLYVDTTYALTAINAYFLVTMFFDFMHQITMANFGYVMLDVYILLFYGATLKLCYLTNKNTNITPPVEVSCV